MVSTRENLFHWCNVNDSGRITRLMDADNQVLAVVRNFRSVSIVGVFSVVINDNILLLRSS